MKTDRFVKDIFKRLDNILNGSAPASSRWDLIAAAGDKTTRQEELGDIETEQYGQPLRFSDYRTARAKKTAPAVGLTYEDV